MKRKKLSFENGYIVLRDEDGKLFWSSHWSDLKNSYITSPSGEPMKGGYKEIYIESDNASLIIKSDFEDEAYKKQF